MDMDGYGWMWMDMDGCGWILMGGIKEGLLGLAQVKIKNLLRWQSMGWCLIYFHFAEYGSFSWLIKWMDVIYGICWLPQWLISWSLTVIGPIKLASMGRHFFCCCCCCYCCFWIVFLFSFRFTWSDLLKCERSCIPVNPMGRYSMRTGNDPASGTVCGTRRGTRRRTSHHSRLECCINWWPLSLLTPIGWKLGQRMLEGSHTARRRSGSSALARATRSRFSWDSIWDSSKIWLRFDWNSRRNVTEQISCIQSHYSFMYITHTHT